MEKGYLFDREDSLGLNEWTISSPHHAELITKTDSTVNGVSR